MLFRDFVYAARVLSKNRTFAITAILTVALGIGASTAIFSVFNAVLLQPLPYKDPDQLVVARGEWRKRGIRDFPFSNADFFDLRAGTSGVFTELGAINTTRAVVPKLDGSLEEIRSATVTLNFFRLIGAKLAAGRDFMEGDGQPPPSQPGGAAVPQATILSYEYWQRRYGGDPSILGKNAPGTQPGTTQIVGVLAPGLELLFPPESNLERAPDFWFAARLAYDVANRNNVSLRIVGRLEQGVSLDVARAKAEVAAAEIRKSNEIRQTADFHIGLEPMSRHLVEEVRPAILALMGATVFLLLIACANVVNLMLVQASLRERDLAVRVALGGSRWRLVQQMLVEALVISTLGALPGVGLAWLAIQNLRYFAPTNLPRQELIAIDPQVLAFATVAAFVVALLFGIIPALQATRANIMPGLRSSSRVAGVGAGRRLRSGVLASAVALSFVLLIGSGLMLRSFAALQRIDTGYDAHDLLTFQLLGTRGGNEPEQRAAFMHEIRSRLQALPGVLNVAASTPFPLTGGFNPIRWGNEEALADPGRFQAADSQIVLPGYFETLHSRLLEGRTFEDADNKPERNGVVIDQFLAAKAFPNKSAIGQRILIRLRTPEPEWVNVIGVVAHQRDSSLVEIGREQIYFTDGFVGHGAVSRWAVRTKGDPAQYADEIRAEIARIGSNLLLTEMRPMEELVVQAQARTRFSLLLIGTLAVLAVVLAAAGLYGVLSTFVRQRKAEIGIRMALGAEPKRILALVIGQGLRLSIAGVGAGLILSFALTRAISSMLVGVTPTDPVTFAAISGLFLLVVVFSSWLPARRAAGIDPAKTLREQ